MLISHFVSLFPSKNGKVQVYGAGRWLIIYLRNGCRDTKEKKGGRFGKLAVFIEN